MENQTENQTDSRPNRPTHHFPPSTGRPPEVDPEVRSDELRQISAGSSIPKQTTEPKLPDMLWKTKHKNEKVSEMDDEFLLKSMRHCIARANLYHSKLNFFLESLSIMEAHADNRGIPARFASVEDIQNLLDNLSENKPYKHPNPITLKHYE